jgi:hypothetical protein
MLPVQTHVNDVTHTSEERIIPFVVWAARTELTEKVHAIQFTQSSTANFCKSTITII